MDELERGAYGDWVVVQLAGRHTAQRSMRHRLPPLPVHGAVDTPAQTPVRTPERAPERAPARTPEGERDVDVRRRILPPYKVILHNDEHNSMDHVVKALRKSVPGMSLGKAVAIMWEAHTNGKALVIACPLELAELYQQRLLSFGLTATIEQD